MSDIGPGTLVECIVDSWGPNPLINMHKLKTPVKGFIYMVRGCVDDTDIGPCLLLEEILNPIADHPKLNKNEPSFGIQGFRPVRQTDITIFQDIVADVFNKETVS